MNAILMRYSYLQLLDLLTTMVFLLLGVREGNPLVRFSIGAAGSPLAGLLLIKGGAVALALFCWWSGRMRLLSRVNLFFAVVIAWNLVALVVAAASR